VLEVRGITKSFGPVRAVQDVSFALHAGEICGLLGPNGAGKTTTIRIALGLMQADAGEVVLLEESVRPGAPVLQRCGALVEEAAFYPYLSGRQNLRLYQRLAGPRDDADVDRVLAVSKLQGAVDRKVRTYSHGMRQRLGVAQAMLGSPDLLILDEPTTGLDPAGIREVRELLRALADRGVGVLLSSHLLAEVELLCDSVVVMSHGRTLRSGSVDEVVGLGGSIIEVDDAEGAVTSLRAAGFEVSSAGENGRLAVTHDGTPRAAIVRSLVEAGIDVSMAAPRTRLEDAFFAITAEPRDEDS
jgi:ABC-2 type transport system ATP-binding protein